MEFHQWVGSGWSDWLGIKYMVVNFGMLPNSAGIVPFNWLFSRFKTVKEFNWTISEGTMPLRLELGNDLVKLMNYISKIWLVVEHLKWLASVQQSGVIGGHPMHSLG